MNSAIRKLALLCTITLFTILTFTGCGIRYIVNTGSNVLDKEDSKEFTLDKTAVDKISKIDINTRIADVEIIPSDNYYVEIDYTYWEDEPEYSIENGVLHFDDKDAFPNSYSLNFNLNNFIKIYLPKDAMLELVSMNDSCGDIIAEGFTADKLNLSVSYGDLTIKNAIAVDSDINLSSGSSRITDFSTGDMKFNNSYGDADFTNINSQDRLLPNSKTFDDFKITMSSGNIKIKGLNSNETDISNSYGDVTCEGMTGKRLDVSLSSGDFEAYRSDLSDISIRDSYGDVTLSLSGSKDDYSLDLNTSYGSIDVDGKSYKDHVVIDSNSSRSIDADLSSGNVDIDFNE